MGLEEKINNQKLLAVSLVSKNLDSGVLFISGFHHLQGLWLRVRYLTSQGNVLNDRIFKSIRLVNICDLN